MEGSRGSAALLVPPTSSSQRGFGKGVGTKGCFLSRQGKVTLLLVSRQKIMTNNGTQNIHINMFRSVNMNIYSNGVSGGTFWCLTSKAMIRRD